MDIMDLALQFNDFEWCKEISKLPDKTFVNQKNNKLVADEPDEIDKINIDEVKYKLFKDMVNENPQQYILTNKMMKSLTFNEKVAYMVYMSQGQTSKEDAKILVKIMEEMKS